MSSFEYIKSIDDLVENLLYLEKVRRVKKESNFEDYVNLIERGISFVTYPIPEGIGFAPTGFLNVKSNSIELYNSIKSRIDGNLTNRMYRILGCKHRNSSLIRQEYFKFCTSLGISKPKTPNGYWNNLFNRNSSLLNHLLDDTIHFPTNLNTQFSVQIQNTTKKQLIEARIGQGKFREILIGYWKGCSHTGFKKTKILRASHIKPWSISTNRERLCLFNGLLLTPNLDALFDTGYISFENSGSILCSNSMSKDEYITLGCNFTHKMKFNEKHYEFLDYHRKEIFQK